MYNPPSNVVNFTVFRWMWLVLHGGYYSTLYVVSFLSSTRRLTNSGQLHVFRMSK